jgi:putative pyruvate formate lyase activating enzyme
MEPGYIALYRSGELERRAQALEARLASCDICPRDCRINRLHGEMGYCHSGHLPIISSVCAHHGEEPALSGTRGSGMVFFGNCNMRCVYCQNYQISQDAKRQKRNETDCHALAEKMLYLQDKLGCHNINFVSPSHFVPQLLRTVVEAVPMGLKVPLVYNTGGYDSLATLKELDGVIDIYLPDLRYASNRWARKFSGAAGYVGRAREAIKEMYRQVGDLVVDGCGVAQKGLIVRHLILPNGLADSRESLTWLVRELSPTVTVSIMSQYKPMHRALDIPLLARKITVAEHEAVDKLLTELGIDNGWVQQMSAADEYLPDFAREGHPFLPPNSRQTMRPVFQGHTPSAFQGGYRNRYAHRYQGPL